MTPRQRDALRWLEGVGEANEFAVHRAGYQARTLDALAKQGRIDRTMVQGRIKPYAIYATHEHRKAMGEIDQHEDHRADCPDLMAALKASLGMVNP